MTPRLRLRQPVFRGHNPRWSFAPESGDGARRHGWRFNRPGVAALYTSLRPETAWLEAQQGFAFKAQPLTICQYDVDCADVVDLTSSAVLASLGTDDRALGCPWERMVDDREIPPSWELAARLRAEGATGILVRSFAAGATPRDINAVFWRWERTPPHMVRVVDDGGRLPRDDRSWR